MGVNPLGSRGRAQGIDHASLMDRVYKRQRHFTMQRANIISLAAIQ